MRYITPSITEDLQRKMVFVGGPRQVGKTTLAKQLLASHGGNGRYFNWDYDVDRQALLNKHWAADAQMLIFDELHKYPHWKNWIKGLFDTQSQTQTQTHQILVTGSARLDLYRHGGDSLIGRYHFWRLHPFTLDEYPNDLTPEQVQARLLTHGGFPEPFLTNDERQSRRWRRERLDRLILEDIRDLESIKNIQGLRLLIDLLRQRVSGMVVFSNLAKDIQVAPQTVKSWIEALEHMYLIFRVPPYTEKIPRAIQKPPKIFFYDNGDVLNDQGPRFENLVATHLLKRLHFLEDYQGYRCELRYLRDKEGREVDFAIIIDGALHELIEVKRGDDKLSGSLRYYNQRLQPQRCTQIVQTLQHPYDVDGIRVTSAIDYFNSSPWEVEAPPQCKDSCCL